MIRNILQSPFKVAIEYPQDISDQITNTFWVACRLAFWIGSIVALSYGWNYAENFGLNVAAAVGTVAMVIMFLLHCGRACFGETD